MNKKTFSHTFVICAYKESTYLENCIKSLKAQTLKTDIIITTSTPNSHINTLAKKYKIPVYIRDGKSDIKEDWNFAYNSAKSVWVTLAHQDDEYNEEYVEWLKRKTENQSDAIAFVSDYIPIKNGEKKRDLNSKIRRFLRQPLKVPLFGKTKFWKKIILSLGNSICCPAVTYNKSILGESFFTSDLKFNIDWDTFLKIANEKGRLVYIDKPLCYYRVHDEATSKEFIVNNKRELEDKEMFSKFWPNWIVNIIMHFYKLAYKTYD